MTCSLLDGEILRHISKKRKATRLKFSIRHAFMAIMTHAKFHFNGLMVTLPDKVKAILHDAMCSNNL